MSRWALERSLFWRAWRGEEGVVTWRVLGTRCCTERRGSPLPGWRIYRHLIPGAASIVLLELRWFVGLVVPWSWAFGQLRAHSWTRQAIHSLPLYTVSEVVTHRFWDDSIFKSGLATMLAMANKLNFKGFRVYCHIKLQDSSSVLRILSIILRMYAWVSHHVRCMPFCLKMTWNTRMNL